VGLPSPGEVGIPYTAGSLTEAPEKFKLTADTVLPGCGVLPMFCRPLGSAG